jgi:hypothetical protein
MQSVRVETVTRATRKAENIGGLSLAILFHKSLIIDHSTGNNSVFVYREWRV